MRKLIALLLVVAVFGIVAYLGFRVGPPPEIAIKPAAEMIGRKTPVTVSVSEPNLELVFLHLTGRALRE